MKESLHDMNDDLLVKYLVGEAGMAEANLVEKWLQASKENQKYYEDLILLWEKSLQLAPPKSVDVDDAWIRMRQRLKQEEHKSRPAGIFRLNNITWLRAAAMLVVIAGLAWIGYFVSNNANDVTMVNVASAQNILSDTLSDGSVITVNKNSKLSYPSKFNANTREVSMQGEAFFQVTPDKRKPFIIHVNDVTVKVVGTSFNIRSVHGKTEVIVETGIVQVTRQNSTVELRPGEKLVTQVNDASIVKDSARDKLYNYYRSREFICDNTSLKRLVEILNEAYDSNIVIENKSIENLPITTVFKDEPLDNILSVISATLGVTVDKTQQQIILK